MKFRCLLAALALTTAATTSQAGPFRRGNQHSYQPTYYPPAYQSYPSMPSAVTPASGYVTNSTPAVTPADGSVTSYYPPAVTPSNTGTGYDAAADGLDEVNAKRAARGLRPFIRDEGLAQGARACATFRAQHSLFGHTSNDFAFAPAGTSVTSTGCAAYPASYGWMSCCVYDNYTYAGAAWVTGRDGQRYMHLFVR